MLDLFVLRHAKSRWDEPSVEDHERGLAPRGVRAAKRAGVILAENRWLPDRVLCSTAKRTQETFALARDTWPAEPEIPTSLLASLYLATPSRLLEIVRRQPDSAGRLLLIGHNPGLQTFVLRLGGRGDQAIRASIESKLPTAGLVRLTFDVLSWRDIAWTTGELAFYDRPPKD